MSSPVREVMHIVLFEWNADATPASIEAAVVELRALKEKVPGILDLSIGTDFSTRARNFSHALVVRFVDKAALEIYGPHPAHDRVVQNFIRPISKDVMAFDYEL